MVFVHLKCHFANFNCITRAVIIQAREIVAVFGLLGIIGFYYHNYVAILAWPAAPINSTYNRLM